MSGTVMAKCMLLIDPAVHIQDAAVMRHCDESLVANLTCCAACLKNAGLESCTSIAYNCLDMQGMS